MCEELLKLVQVC